MPDATAHTLQLTRCTFRAVLTVLLSSFGILAMQAQQPAAASSVGGILHQADSLEARFEALAEDGNYTEALLMTELALSLRAQALGAEAAGNPDSTAYYHTLARHGKFLSYLGRLDEALNDGERVRQYHEHTSGTKSKQYATALLDLAGYHSRSGHYAEAVKLGEQVVPLRKKLFGTESVEYAQSLNHLSKYLSYVSQFKRAIELETEAIAIRSRLKGEHDAVFAQMLSNLAGYHSRSGHYDDAIRYGEQALEIRRDVLGEEHPDYAQSLNHLARYHSYKGNYHLSVDLGTQAVELRRKLYGDHHPETAQSLSNLAGYYSRMGNYRAAVRVGMEAFQIREQIMDDTHPDYAQSVNNLARYYYFLGEYNHAVQWGSRALDLRERQGGRFTRDYANTLANQADYYDGMGDYDKAQQTGMMAIAIRDSVLGREHPDFAESLASLANFNYHKGDYKEAVKYGENALERIRAIFGTDHTYYAQALSNQAIYYAYNRDDSLAQQTAITATQRYTDAILTTFANLTAAERNHYWHSVNRWYLHQLPAFTSHFPTRPIIENAYNATLLAKGLLLNSEIEMQNLIIESNDSALAQRYQELQQTHRLINEQFSMPKARRTLNIDSLFKQVKRDERTLLQQCKAYGDYTQNLRINWQSVRQQLHPDELAVEFIRYRSQLNDSTYYAAFTLGADYETPHFTVICNDAQLKAVRSKRRYTTDALANLLFGPIRKELEGVSTIYFSPTGELYTIAVESLPLWNKQGIAGERWQMYRLSSTRQLAVNQRRNKLQNASIYGGIAYGMMSMPEPTANTDSLKLNLLPDSLQKEGIEYLPATLTEARNIATQLQENGINITLYTGDDGTEEAFREQVASGKTQLLHIATHGFYWTEKQVERKASKEKLNFLGMLRGKSEPEDRMLMGSGLFLAGANEALLGQASQSAHDDGILTAWEISKTDLRSVELAVLSACQTGLGTVNGDGVFGLQRGFKKAGCQTLLMSLWSVDDRATEMLMEHFYSHLAEGQTKLQALRMAQQEVRNYTDSNGKTPFADPFYWAAFILLDALD